MYILSLHRTTFIVCDDRYASAPKVVNIAQIHSTTNILTCRLCMLHKAIQFCTTVNGVKVLHKSKSYALFCNKIDAIIINHTEFETTATTKIAINSKNAPIT